MHRKILNLKRKIRKNKRKISVTSFVIFACIVVGTIGFSYYFIKGEFVGTATVTIPSFAPKVNGSESMSQTIDLKTTITNNKNLAPGAIGSFKIDIDFSKVSKDSYYKVYLDRTNIPNNIHFYIDKNLTTELTSIEGVELEDNSNKLAEHYIYWTWIYNDNPESNENDSLYMGQEINLPFFSYLSQKVEKNTIIVNGYEKPTGRVNINGQSGSFDMSLNFANISTSTNYKIYFDDIPSNVHLYSDSSHQNEITSINDFYNGENQSVNKTIYWKTADMANVNASIYYIVSLS